MDNLRPGMLIMIIIGLVGVYLMYRDMQKGDTGYLSYGDARAKMIFFIIVVLIGFAAMFGLLDQNPFG